MKAILIEPFTGMRVMVRGVLMAFGIKKLYEPRSSLEALRILMEEPVDFFICADNIKPYDANLCHKLIRTTQEEQIRHMRTLVTVEEESEQVMKKLVNSGCDDIISLPFSADDIAARLQRLMRNRGAFIETKAYVGPERRKMDITLQHDERRSELSNPGQAEFKFSLRQLIGRLFKMEADLKEKRKKDQATSRLKPGVLLDDVDGAESYQVTWEGLRIGLEITQPVKTESDMLVLPAGTSLKRKSIARLKDLINNGQIQDAFYVKENNDGPTE
jgi:two-component system, chemotaxis family, chemotaxis protein CheY